MGHCKEEDSVFFHAGVNTFARVVSEERGKANTAWLKIQKLRLPAGTIR
jgi:hypothetical protein